MALALHPTQERVILHGVTWATFERLLADRGDHASVRIAYDQGTMELTMPSAEHETVKQFLVLIVDAIALARDLHLLNVGSTTFTRADLARGFEPDACFGLDHGTGHSAPSILPCGSVARRGGLNGAGGRSTDCKIAANIERGF